MGDGELGSQLALECGEQSPHLSEARIGFRCDEEPVQERLRDVVASAVHLVHHVTAEDPDASPPVVADVGDHHLAAGRVTRCVQDVHAGKARHGCERSFREPGPPQAPGVVQLLHAGPGRVVGLLRLGGGLEELDLARSARFA